jgi:hypothetical protein
MSSQPPLGRSTARTLATSISKLIRIPPLEIRQLLEALAAAG